MVTATEPTMRELAKRRQNYGREVDLQLYETSARASEKRTSKLVRRSESSGARDDLLVHSQCRARELCEARIGGRSREYRR